MLRQGRKLLIRLAFQISRDSVRQASKQATETETETKRERDRERGGGRRKRGEWDLRAFFFNGLSSSRGFNLFASARARHGTPPAKD